VACFSKFAAECEAEAENAAAKMLAHKRRMLLLRQRAAVLREMTGPGPEAERSPAAP